MIEHTKVSLFPNIGAVKNPQNITLKDFYDGVKNGQWSDQVLNYRSLLSKYGKEATKGDKGQLPYITTSGTFHYRNEAGLVSHSGYIAMDFDPEENPAILTYFNSLCDDSFSATVFHSCSGLGICVVVKIQPDKHRESFEYLQKYYKENFGLIVDAACKDVSRPRFVSFDENLFINETSEVSGALDIESGELTERAPRALPENFDPESKLAEALAVTQRIVDAGIDITSGYKNWMNLAFSLSNLGEDGRDIFHNISQFNEGYTVEGTDKQFDACLKHNANPGNKITTIGYFFKVAQDCGIDIIVRRSQSAVTPIVSATAILEPVIAEQASAEIAHTEVATEDQKKYEERMKEMYAEIHAHNRQGDKINSVLVENLSRRYGVNKDKVTSLATTIYESHEDQHDIDEAPAITKIENYLKRKYDIFMNQVSMTTEVCDKIKGDKKLVPLNQDAIYIELLKIKFKISKSDVVSLLNTDLVQNYCPIEKYMRSTPAWDQKTDYISMLADYVKTDDQEFFREQFKKALVRTIACAVSSYINRVCMVFVGAQQEVGKSSFIRFLCPKELKEYYSEAPITEHKDMGFRLSDNFIYNIEELSYLNRGDASYLKALISSDDIKGRRAYAKSEEKYRRRASFWGSTNNDTFLIDETGNTRWLCFNVLGIDHGYANYMTGESSVNIDNVWSQAWYLYNNGFKFELTKDEAKRRDLKNKEHEVISAEHELIAMYFTQAATGEGEFMTSTEITNEISLYANKIQLKKTYVEKALGMLGFKQDRRIINGSRLRGYWLYRSTYSVNKKTDEVKPILPKEVSLDNKDMLDEDIPF